MKTSLDLPDELYRRVKSKSALEGKAVREVATALFTAWVNGQVPSVGSGEPEVMAGRGEPNASQQWLSRWKALGDDVAQSTARDHGLLDQLHRDRR